MKLLRQPNKLEILGDGTQIRSYIHVNDAVEATLLAWRKSIESFEVYNVESEDWVTVNDVAGIVISVMGLEDVEYIYRPILHGVGWLGDMKQIALDIDRLKSLGWRPRMNSREAVLDIARSLLHELLPSSIE